MLLYIAGIVKTDFSLEAFCNSSVLVLLSGTERQKASPAGDDSMAGAGTPNMFYIQPLCSLPIYLPDTHFSFQWARSQVFKRGTQKLQQVKDGENTPNTATALVLPTPEIWKDCKLEVSPSKEGLIHIS